MSETFALTNPLVRFLEQRPDQFTRADFLRVITERGIERVAFQHLGLDGKLKESRLPIANRQQHETLKIMHEDLHRHWWCDRDGQCIPVDLTIRIVPRR
jgi:hypothetical protein